MRIYKGHARLSKCMRAVGYKSNIGGVCYGYVHMGVQALLLNDITTFDNRIRLIFDNEENLAEVIQTHKDQWNNSEKILSSENDLPESKRTLTSARRKIIEQQMVDNRKYMDIPAFFEGIELYFQPREYRDFLGPEQENLSQNAMLTAPFVVPQEIESKSGLDTAGKFTGFYNKNEIILYLKALENMFYKINPPNFFRDPKKPLHPIALVLNSINHTIAIGHDSESWFLIDPNKIPTVVFSRDNIDQLADEIIESFVVNKANPNIALETAIWVSKKDKNKIMPHVNAIYNDEQWKSIHQLTKEKANLTDTNQASLMQVAAQMGDIDKVKSLLELGADPNTALSGNSALQLAAQNGHIGIVNLLLDQPNLEKFQYLKALHMAALYNHIDIVYLLLEVGAKAEQPDALGRTVLFFASVYGHNKLVKCLLENKKIDVNEATNDRSTALMEACKGGYNDVVETLLNSKAKANLFDKFNMSALMYAAKNGHLSTINLLLTWGVDPSAKVLDSDPSPLMLSITQGHLEIMETLLEAQGFSYNKPLNSTDLIAYLLESTNKNHYRIAETILKYADDDACKTAFNYALKENNEKCIKVLYPRVKVIFVATNEQTPLHIAARDGSTRVVNTLLEMDPELINKKDSNQQSAFDLARDNRRPAVIATLTYHSSQINKLTRVAIEVKNALTSPHSFFKSFSLFTSNNSISEPSKVAEDTLSSQTPQVEDKTSFKMRN